VLIVHETLCLAGEDAVLVEGEVPSQEVTGRPVESQFESSLLVVVVVVVVVWPENMQW
jgi:hypothetical protein